MNTKIDNKVINKVKDIILKEVKDIIWYSDIGMTDKQILYYLLRQMKYKFHNNLFKCAFLVACWSFGLDTDFIEEIRKLLKVRKNTNINYVFRGL